MRSSLHSDPNRAFRDLLRAESVVNRTAAIVVTLGLSACLPRPPAANEQPSPEILLDGVSVWIYRGARLVATGHARNGVYDREAGNGTAQVVDFKVAPSGRDARQGGRAAKGIDLNANQVVGGLRTQLADASGNVTVRTGVGDRAVTPTAHFDGNVKVATGHDGVVIDGPDYHTTAPEFRLSLGDERLELLGGVHSQTGVRK